MLFRKLHDISLPIPHSKGTNWVNPGIVVIRVAEGNLCMAASTGFKKNERLVVYGGKVFTLTEYESLAEELQHFPYQIDDDLFLGPPDMEELSAGERLNHSCEPNAGFVSEITLVAIRDIEIGELITIDYAMCGSTTHTSYMIDCKCGSSLCRKQLTGEDWKIKEVQSRLFEYFQPFLKRKILKHYI